LFNSSPTSDRRRHLLTCVGATPAGGGTLLTMVVLVLGALIAATLANLCAQPAQLLCEVTTAGHVCRGLPADSRAVHVQRNATRHHLDVLLLQAGGRTVIACISTSVARLDTVLIHLVGHYELLELVGGNVPHDTVMPRQSCRSIFKGQGVQDRGRCSGGGGT
jgi:hypothetical protein